MANAEQLDILKQGVEVWNEWRMLNFATGINLMDTNFTEMDFSGANFNGANFNKSILRGTILEKAHLQGAYLQDSQMKWRRGLGGGSEMQTGNYFFHPRNTLKICFLNKRGNYSGNHEIKKCINN